MANLIDTLKDAYVPKARLSDEDALTATKVELACLDAAKALIMARELFMLAATTAELNAEGAAKEALTEAQYAYRDNLPGDQTRLDRAVKRLARATAKVEAKRAEAFKRFNSATGCA